MKKLTMAARHLGLTRGAGALLILVISTMALSTSALAYSTKTKSWSTVTQSGGEGKLIKYEIEKCMEKYSGFGDAFGSYWDKNHLLISNADNCKCDKHEGIVDGKYVVVECKS